MAQDQPVRGLFVKDRVDQDVACVRRGIIVAKILDGFAQKTAILSGPGNFDALLGESIDVLKK